MIVAPSQDWNVFKQIFAEHWDGFKLVYPRYNKPYYDGLVDKMGLQALLAKKGIHLNLLYVCT